MDVHLLLLVSPNYGTILLVRTFSHSPGALVLAPSQPPSPIFNPDHALSIASLRHYTLAFFAQKYVSHICLLWLTRRYYTLVSIGRVLDYYMYDFTRKAYPDIVCIVSAFGA